MHGIHKKVGKVKRCAKGYMISPTQPVVVAENTALFTVLPGEQIGVAILNKSRALEVLAAIEASPTLDSLKAGAMELKEIISFKRPDTLNLLNINLNGDTVGFRKDVLLSEIDQVLESQSQERAIYYLRRLQKGINQVRTTKINDINLLRWKEYSDIITDSLWILGKRGTSGVHMAWYWGNFIPQIPRQLMLRYTKKGDWVLDPFAGSGTTLIECRRLQRNGLGVEINPEVASKAQELISLESNPWKVVSDLAVGDSTDFDFGQALHRHSVKQVQLVILHPPYHDIIKFSSDPRDLSNCRTVDEFLQRFGSVIENVTPVLEKKRYLSLVIGDKYSKGEWIPLGFYCMNEVLKRGYSLKAIIVKNFEDTRAKRNQKNCGG